MKLSHLLAATAATVFVAGVAAAQEPSQPAPSSAAPSTDTSASAPAPAAATGSAVSSSVTTTDPATGATRTVTTFTNGPVPDTAENRKRFGGPMSHAGRRTKPAGN